MAKKKTFENIISNLLGEPVSNLCHAFYDQYVEANVKFRSRAGMKEVIIRRQLGKCCKWCADLAGIYEYGDHPDDIFRRHDNCKCMVTYKDEDGYTDVWTKKNFDAQREARKTRERGLIVNEASTKRRKALNQRSLVDEELIWSNDYKHKIDSLADDRKESRAISNSAKEILTHRSGTFFEDLSFYNTRTGKRLTNKSFDYYKDGISACKPNRLMIEMLNSEEDHVIIAIHNHPKSGAPSLADIISARDGKYKYGIVLCHNGKIYKYRILPTFTEAKEWECEFHLAKVEKAVYNDDVEKLEEAITSLRSIGIELEVR